MDLDQAATVTWLVMDETQEAASNQPLFVKQSREKKFESVTNAVVFVMEKLSTSNRATAMIHTDAREIQMPETEVLYSQIKRD